MADSPQHILLQLLRSGYFLVVALCVLVYGFQPVWAKANYPEQPCLEKLHQSQFRSAVDCMAKLHKKTRRHSYLLSLALLHEKAGEFHAGQKPSESCYYLDKAVELYRQYLRRERRIRKDQKVYIQRNLSRLVQRINYAQLKIVSRPGVARISLSSVFSGRQLKWDVRSPHRFATLCPGKYKLEARRKGFEASLVEVSLKPRQSVLRKIKLQPIPRPPVPAWAWTLIGAGGVGVVGGLLYFFAEDRRRALEAKLGQDVNWKENRNTAQTLSMVSTGLFVGAGVGAAAALVVYLVNRNQKLENIPRGPRIHRSLNPNQSPSPATPSTRVTLWKNPSIGDF